ncbi:hypothetical protein OV079_11740 [Nannocystis pusilla]|uniref:Uncharacterized protein n=1 Tax=Nannocystis pusilla TaxID=889268 RepID=A0A9X3IWR6_9BACT|nr:hypothetical protein [Nannocystis pusilla]MCY1006220.1 hypothetical protein [Nannocystis pusilla]
MRADPKGQVAFSLECGRQRCASDRELLALVRSVEGHVPSVIKDRTRLPELLPPGDIPGYKEMPISPVAERYEYDRIRLDATVRDVAYSLGVWVWLRPTEGLAEKLAALQAEIPNARVDDSVASGAIVGDAASGNGTQYAFAVPATEVVIRMQCSAGLCPTPEVARSWPSARIRRPTTPATSSTRPPNARSRTCRAATSKAAQSESGCR